MPRLSAVVTEDGYRRVVRFVRGGAARRGAELVRLAVTEYTRKAGIVKLVNLRGVPVSEAKRAVERYLKKRGGAVWPDEMAEEPGDRLPRSARRGEGIVGRGKGGRDFA